MANLVGGIVLDRGDWERLIREKCIHQWQIPSSERSRLSRTTLKSMFVVIMVEPWQ
jgi:hypothetical protein